MTSPQSRSLIPVEVAAVALAAVIGTWVIAAPGTVSGWERQIFASINGLADWLFPILWGPMQMGALLGAAIVVVGFLVMGRRPCAATYAAASAGGWLVAAAVKEIVARPRPLGAGIDAIVRGTAASGFGFISGHTTVAFAGATVIWVFYGRRWGLAAYLVATMVGIARIYVGAHLPLDVIGGAAAGTIMGGLVTWVELRILSRRSRPPSSTSPIDRYGNGGL